MKTFFKLLLLIAGSLSVGQSLYSIREGFSLRKLQTLPSQTTYIIDEETKQILSQPFYYLGKGRQCFAFSSEDGKYVLKCPRTNIYKLPFWSRSLPLKTKREKLRADKIFRRGFVFESFRLAFEELKNETGLVAIHLGKSEGGREQITIVDSLGFRHHLPLHTTIFVLQHKQPLWTPQFLEAKEEGNTAQKKLLLDALVDVIIDRSKKGCFTRDRSFLRNYGFNGAKAYQIDIGDFYRRTDIDPAWVFYKSVYDTLAPVQEWLAKVDPEMLQYLNSRLATLQ